MIGPAGPQGIAGPVGPAGPPAPPPVIAAAGGLAGNGTAAQPLQVTFGGTGTSTQVARADHQHDGPTRLYSRLLTPRVLQAEATFNPGRPATVTATTLDFPAGVGEWNRLFALPMLPGGALAPGEAYVVRIVVDQTVASVDNDPTIGITDGTTFFGFVKGDASNTEMGWAFKSAYGVNLDNAAVLTSLPGPGANINSFEVLIRIEPQVGGTTDLFITARAGTAAVRHAYLANSFNRAAPLTFAVFANNPPEVYRFHDFEVTVSRDE